MQQRPETLQHQRPAKIGILITNLGTPEAPTTTAVRRYLREFLSDRRVVELPRLLWWPILNGLILPFRPHKTAKLYQKIWTESGSPLQSITANQAVLLQEQLTAHYGDEIIVDYAMRYGSPSIHSALERMHQHNVQQLLVLPLYPQYSATTTGATFDSVMCQLQQRRWIPQVHLQNHYADNPLYIAALSDSVQAHISQHGMPDKLVFSFHGLPQKNLINGDPYYCYCQKTARLVAKQLELANDQWQVTFQSRFGAAKWLQPYTDITLQELAKNGDEHVAIICPGFAADCLETLEEINITNRELFMNAGGKRFHYIKALNTNKKHIDTLVTLASQHIDCFKGNKRAA